MNPYEKVLTYKKANLTPAQESIRNTFISLCRVHPYSSISVTELCKKASVARTTFYASYPNTDALLEEIEDGLVANLIEYGNKGLKKRGLDYVSGMFSYVRDHRDVLELLLCIRPDIRFINKWKDAVKFHVYDYAVARVDPDNVGLALEMFASMVITGYTYYLEHPDELNLVALSHAVTRSFDEISKEK